MSDDQPAGRPDRQTAMITTTAYVLRKEVIPAIRETNALLAAILARLDAAPYAADVTARNTLSEVQAIREMLS